MSCYHPKLAYKKFSPDQDKYFVSFSNNGAHVDGARQIKIPCGKCIGCLRDRAMQWAIRCACEYETTVNKLDCYFLTLTYSDDKLSFSPVFDVDDDGVVTDITYIPTLRKRDLQLFLKRCREHFSDSKLRYLACGEYGGQTARPHYHAVIFNLPLSDLVPYKSKDSTSLYYTSCELNDLWSNGNVLIARYDFHTADYVAKYMVKQDPDSIVDGREKPFLTMSRRPGLGRMYYDLHKDSIAVDDKVYTSFGIQRPPAYFDRIDREERPTNLFERKNLRSDAAEFSDATVIRNTDKDFVSRNLDAEQSQIARKRVRKL